LFAPHTYIFVLRAHPVRGESHNQRNTTGEVATGVKNKQSKSLQLSKAVVSLASLLDYVDRNDLTTVGKKITPCWNKMRDTIPTKKPACKD